MGIIRVSPEVQQQINDLIDSNPVRSYSTTINHPQLLDLIAGMQLLIAQQAHLLAQRPHHEPEYFSGNGLDAAKQMLDNLLNMRDDPEHRNSINYGLLV